MSEIANEIQNKFLINFNFNREELSNCMAEILFLINEEDQDEDRVLEMEREIENHNTNTKENSFAVNSATVNRQNNINNSGEKQSFFDISIFEDNVSNMIINSNDMIQTELFKKKKIQTDFQFFSPLVNKENKLFKINSLETNNFQTEKFHSSSIFAGNYISSISTTNLLNLLNSKRKISKSKIKILYFKKSLKIKQNCNNISSNLREMKNIKKVNTKIKSNIPNTKFKHKKLKLKEIKRNLKF